MLRELSMADINYIFLLSLSIIVLGFVVKKLKIVTEEGGKMLAKLILNVTLPALILLVASTIKIELTLLLLPLICALFSFLVLAFSFIAFKNRSRDEKGLITISVIGFNMGLFAFPLIESIWGVEGLQYIAMVDIGNAFMIFVISYSIGSIFSPKNQAEGKQVNGKHIVKSLLKSVPLMSYIIALSVNIGGLKFPVFVIDLLNILSRANMALTLLLLGIYLNFKFEKAQWNLVIKILIIRYSFGIIVGVLLFLWLPFVTLFRAIILVGLVLPLSMATVPYAVELGYNEKLVGMTTNLSIIISFSLLWIFMLLLGIS